MRPQRHSRLFVVVPLACSTLICVGCATSFKYDASAVKRFDLGSKPPAIMLADVMSGGGLSPSGGGELYDEDSETVYRELNLSVRQHCIASGLIAENGPFARAPETAEELRHMLDDAVANDVRAVLMIRPDHMGSSGNIPVGVKIADLFIVALMPVGIGVIPWVIVDSLPVRTERASVGVEGVLVDPESGSVLWTSSVSEQRRRKATGWRYNPPRQIAPAFQEAVQKLLGEASLSIRDDFAGHPTDMDAATLLFPAGS
jgi:hypothetical protein